MVRIGAVTPEQAKSMDIGEKEYAYKVTGGVRMALFKYKRWVKE
jgi:hypothetical protein